MSVKTKATSIGGAAVSLGPRSTEIGPITLPQQSAELRMSRSEKTVCGIAMGVLLAGFATGILGASAAQGSYAQPHVAHIEHDTKLATPMTGWGGRVHSRAGWSFSGL